MKVARLLGDRALFEDELVRMGRLDENDAVEQKLARGRYARMGSQLLGLPSARSSRPRSAEGATSFHFAHTTVAKAGRSPAGVPTEVTPDGRVYVFPGRGRAAEAKAAGARRDRQSGAWWVRAGSAGEAALGHMRTPAARAQWMARSGGSARRLRAAPGEFQRYVERARLAEENRQEIETDGAGAISLGTIGETPAERAAFWDEVARRERADGRVQCRIIAELPHELTPSGRRRIVESFVEALAAKGLPYHAAVHRPDPAKGMDPRNVHLHVVYHDRPAERTGRNSWWFAARKDRTAQGPTWIRDLREHLAAAANREIAAENERRAALGERPVGRHLDPRSYEAMGIAKPAARHLGPTAAAFERAGRPTSTGVVNAVKEMVWQRAERAAALRPLADRLTALNALAAKAPPAARERAEAELRSAAQAIAAALPDEPGRLDRVRLRHDWSIAEGQRVERMIARHGDRATASRRGRGDIDAGMLAALLARRRRLQEIERETRELLAIAPAHRTVAVSVASSSEDTLAELMRSAVAAMDRARGILEALQSIREPKHGPKGRRSPGGGMQR